VALHRELLRLEPVSFVIKNSRLRWFGHIEHHTVYTAALVSGSDVGVLQDSTLVYRSLSMALAYLPADCQCQLSSKEGRRQLHSADSRTCIVGRTYSNFSDQCFAAASPSLWNRLPAGLRLTVISCEPTDSLSGC